jgi:hypothetical protein
VNPPGSGAVRGLRNKCFRDTTPNMAQFTLLPLSRPPRRSMLRRVRT